MEPGSFILTYSDTDSVALAVTRTKPIPQDASLALKLDAIFSPILRLDKQQVLF